MVHAIVDKRALKCLSNRDQPIFAMFLYRALSRLAADKESGYEKIILVSAKTVSQSIIFYSVGCYSVVHLSYGIISATMADLHNRGCNACRLLCNGFYYIVAHLWRGHYDRTAFTLLFWCYAVAWRTYWL